MNHIKHENDVPRTQPELWTPSPWVTTPEAVDELPNEPNLPTTTLHLLPPGRREKHTDLADTALIHS